MGRQRSEIRDWMERRRPSTNVRAALSTRCHDETVSLSDSAGDSRSVPAPALQCPRRGRARHRCRRDRFVVRVAAPIAAVPAATAAHRRRACRRLPLHIMTPAQAAAARRAGSWRLLASIVATLAAACVGVAAVTLCLGGAAASAAPFAPAAAKPSGSSARAAASATAALPHSHAVAVPFVNTRLGAQRGRVIGPSSRSGPSSLLSRALPRYAGCELARTIITIAVPAMAIMEMSGSRLRIGIRSPRFCSDSSGPVLVTRTRTHPPTHTPAPSRWPSP